MYGQASPQPVVTTTSACSASSLLRLCGRRSERSMPNSRMTSTTWECTRPLGSASLPADSAWWRRPAARSNRAALICERPVLCRQTNRTVAMPLLRLDVVVLKRVPRMLAANELVAQRADGARVGRDAHDDQHQQ